MVEFDSSEACRTRRIRVETEKSANPLKMKAHHIDSVRRLQILRASFFSKSKGLPESDADGGRTAAEPALGVAK